MCWFIGFMKSISERNSMCKRYYGSPSYLHSAWERSCCRTRTPLNCRNTNPLNCMQTDNFPTNQPIFYLPQESNTIIVVWEKICRISPSVLDSTHFIICSVDGEGLASVCEYLSKKRERLWAFFGHIWSGLVLCVSDIFRFICLFSTGISLFRMWFDNPRYLHIGEMPASYPWFNIENTSILNTC